MTEVAYFLFRFILSLAHSLIWLIVLRRTVSIARRAQTPDQRLFVLAVVFVLFVVSALTLVSTAWNLIAPLPTDAVRATIGTSVGVVLGIAGGVIVWKWNAVFPRDKK